jgi:hypothetical protein
MDKIAGSEKNCEKGERCFMELASIIVQVLEQSTNQPKVPGFKSCCSCELRNIEENLKTVYRTSKQQ